VKGLPAAPDVAGGPRPGELLEVAHDVVEHAAVGGHVHGVVQVLDRDELVVLAVQGHLHHAGVALAALVDHQVLPVARDARIGRRGIVGRIRPVPDDARLAVHDVDPERRDVVAGWIAAAAGRAVDRAQEPRLGAGQGGVVGQQGGLRQPGRKRTRRALVVLGLVVGGAELAHDAQRDGGLLGNPEHHVAVRAGGARLRARGHHAAAREAELEQGVVRSLDLCPGHDQDRVGIRMHGDLDVGDEVVAGRHRPASGVAAPAAGRAAGARAALPAGCPRRRPAAPAAAGTGAARSGRAATTASARAEGGAAAAPAGVAGCAARSRGAATAAGRCPARPRGRAAAARTAGRVRVAAAGSNHATAAAAATGCRPATARLVIRPGRAASGPDGSACAAAAVAAFGGRAAAGPLVAAREAAQKQQGGRREASQTEPDWISHGHLPTWGLRR
jgi:hypothetical protein